MSTLDIFLFYIIYIENNLIAFLNYKGWYLNISKIIIHNVSLINYIDSITRIKDLNVVARMKGKLEIYVSQG